MVSRWVENLRTLMPWSIRPGEVILPPMTPPFSWSLVVKAYSMGYFPMADSKTGEVSWYLPNPRAILPLESFHASRSLKATIRKGEYRVSFDEAFADVMKGCADRPETWISSEFMRVYGELHDRGLAHSVEIWQGDELSGGVYGVSLGAAFFAESKFHRKTDCSKLALHHLVNHLVEKKFTLLEVQFLTPHLESLGAIEIDGEHYQALLSRAITKDVTF